MVKKKRKIGTIGLIVLLLLVVSGGVLFVGAVSGWFSDSKVILDDEYNCTDECDFVKIDANQYEDLIKEQKSFILLVDQGGCKTADKMRDYMSEWSRENHKLVYRMMFEEMKKTSLHDLVKYYPSVVVVGKGQVKAFLKADSDEDAEKYNNFDELNEWIRKYVN